MKDEEIIRGIRNRDGAVMVALMKTYSRLLWKVTGEVLWGAGGEADAEECIADVYIALWERPEAFDPTRGTLKSWLCMTARCKAIDRYRTLSRSRTVPMDEVMEAVTDGVSETVMREETYRELTAALESLDESERDILLRRYEVGQKPRTIAKALGLTVKQVDNTLYRTKQKLRQILTRSEGD